MTCDDDEFIPLSWIVRTMSLLFNTPPLCIFPLLFPPFLFTFSLLSNHLYTPPPLSHTSQAIMNFTESDSKAINTIRVLAADTVFKSNSGHPGILPSSCFNTWIFTIHCSCFHASVLAPFFFLTTHKLSSSTFTLLNRCSHGLCSHGALAVLALHELQPQESQVGK